MSKLIAHGEATVWLTDKSTGRELIRKCVEENTRAALNQAEYQRRYDALVTRYKTAKARLDEITGEITRLYEHQHIL